VDKGVAVEHDTVDLSQFENGSVQNEQAITNVEAQDMIRESLVDNSPKDDHHRTPVMEEKTVEDDTNLLRQVGCPLAG
jgi:hypothetical protein